MYFGEANGCADTFSRMGTDQSASLEVFDVSPTLVVQCVFRDTIGVASPRLVVIDIG